MTQPSVTVYSAPWCGYCTAVKHYLQSKNITFTEKDVDEKREYAEEAVQKSGQMGIPVLDIDGQIIVGYDRPTIDRLLSL